jgi:hypothetical protein
MVFSGKTMNNLTKLGIGAACLITVISGAMCSRPEPEPEPQPEPEPEPTEEVITLEEQRTEEYMMAVAELSLVTEGGQNTFFQCLVSTLFDDSYAEAQEKKVPIRDVLADKAKHLLSAQEDALKDVEVFGLDAGDDRDNTQSFILNMSALAYIWAELAEIETSADPNVSVNDIEIKRYCQIEVDDFIASVERTVKAGSAVSRDQNQAPIGRLVPINSEVESNEQ